MTLLTVVDGVLAKDVHANALTEIEDIREVLDLCEAASTRNFALISEDSKVCGQRECKPICG